MKPTHDDYLRLHPAAAAGDLATLCSCLAAGVPVNTPDGDGLTPLEHAIRNGQEDAVRVLLAAGADPNAGEGTALYSAVEQGSEAMLSLLLRAGAETGQESGRFYETALHLAARQGQAGIVSLLLEHSTAELEQESGDFPFFCPLHGAVQSGQVETVRLLLAAGADVNHMNQTGLAPLHLCNDKGLDVLPLLLSAGADVEATGSGGWTPLHCAVLSKSPKMVRALLAAGAVAERGLAPTDSLLFHGNTQEAPYAIVSPDDEDYERFIPMDATALELAAEDGSLGIMELLLAQGVSEHARDRALLAAAEKGDGTAMRLLLSAGVSREQKDATLRFALEGGQFGAVRCLLLAGALFPADYPFPLHRALCAGDAPLRQRLLADGAEAEAEDSYGWRPLTIAVALGDREAAADLLQAGACANGAPDDTYPPLHRAVGADDAAMLRLLLAHGAAASRRNACGGNLLATAAHGNCCAVLPALVAAGVDMMEEDDYGRTPLSIGTWWSKPRAWFDALMAARPPVHSLNKSGENAFFELVGLRPPACVQAMLAQGVDIHARCGPWQRTALHAMAVFNSPQESVRLLLEAGADVNTRNAEGDTPLHDAVWEKTELTRLLLSHGADPNSIGAEGDTPLHHAAMSRKPVDAIFRALLAAGANPNARNKQGMTPLHLLLQHGGDRPFLTRMLLAGGADPLAVSAEGRTPLHVAEEEQKAESAALLRAALAGASTTNTPHTTNTQDTP